MLGLVTEMTVVNQTGLTIVVLVAAAQAKLEELEELMVELAEQAALVVHQALLVHL
jgi:GAF domain-containing protein